MKAYRLFACPVHQTRRCRLVTHKLIQGSLIGREIRREPQRLPAAAPASVQMPEGGEPAPTPRKDPGLMWIERIVGPSFCHMGIPQWHVSRCLPVDTIQVSG